MRRGWRWGMLCAMALVLAGCASTGSQMSALERAQYAWSAAIRWNDFEGAWNLVDPAFRDAQPMRQVQHLELGLAVGMQHLHLVPQRVQQPRLLVAGGSLHPR